MNFRALLFFLLIVSLPFKSLLQATVWYAVTSDFIYCCFGELLGFVGKRLSVVFRFPCCEGRFLKWALMCLISKACKDHILTNCISTENAVLGNFIVRVILSDSLVCFSQRKSIVVSLLTEDQVRSP